MTVDEAIKAAARELGWTEKEIRQAQHQANQWFPTTLGSRNQQVPPGDERLITELFKELSDLSNLALQQRIMDLVRKQAREAARN